jgi:hypothetical protein
VQDNKVIRCIEVCSGWAVAAIVGWLLWLSWSAGSSGQCVDGLQVAVCMRGPEEARGEKHEKRFQVVLFQKQGETGSTG